MQIEQTRMKKSFAREFRNSWNSTSLAREGCCDCQAFHFCHHPSHDISFYLARLKIEVKFRWCRSCATKKMIVQSDVCLKKRQNKNLIRSQYNCTKNTTTTTTTTTLSEHHQHPTATSLSASMKLNFLIYSCDTYIDIYIYIYMYININIIFIFIYIYIYFIHTVFFLFLSRCCDTIAYR